MIFNSVVYRHIFLPWCYVIFLKRAEGMSYQFDNKREVYTPLLPPLFMVYLRLNRINFSFKYIGLRAINENY